MNKIKAKNPQPESTPYYDKSVIKKSLLLLKKGYSKRQVCEKLNVSTQALSKWMKKYNIQDTCTPRYTKLSPLQRRSIAFQILQGTLTISEANDVYNIRGHDTIAKWVRLLKKENVDISTLKADVVQEEDLSKPDDGELEALKAALSEAQLKITALNTLIDVAEEELNINIRKKSGARQS
ncbi:COG3415 family protein [Sphingobacterium pedocola]|uniref:Transposase n=1 Tax=Sphingobacterium pedocola TaxID=2082722 RepID=A0ABR9T309_9SPHI|nr:helix-turn-helix domain-containing protein [Sphingobacterium pedocola]MBE8719732.1 hypothetical protein [Sphingobacterium pedocola]